MVGIAVGGHAGTARLGGWSAVGTSGAYGNLQAAGLLFFAFAQVDEAYGHDADDDWPTGFALYPPRSAAMTDY